MTHYRLEVEANIPDDYVFADAKILIRDIVNNRYEYDASCINSHPEPEEVEQ